MEDFLLFTSAIALTLGIFLFIAHRAQPGWWKEDEADAGEPKPPDVR